MDHSRSPRRYHNAGGQVSYYPPLSDEVGLLRRLVEQVGADAVEAAVDQVGGDWADAYHLLRPDWQPTPTDIGISNQRAAELTAARVQIARLAESISVLRTEITRLQAENTRLQALASDAALTTPPPFTG